MPLSSSTPTQSPAHSFVPRTVPTSLQAVGSFGLTRATGLLPAFRRRVLSECRCRKADGNENDQRPSHHPALRFLVVFLTEVFSGLAVFPSDVRLARSAPIRSTTLLGAAFLVAAMGCPFCFFASSSVSAAS